MRIEQLTFTRFIAAVVVVIFHFGSDVFPFQNPLLHPLVLSANIGVSYFFILSGFVMIIAYNKQTRIDFKQYYIFRIARIFPAFLVSFILILVYFILIGKEIELKNVILQILLLHGWIKKYCLSLNFPSWSLTVEILFYVLFPFIFNHFYKKNKKRHLYFFILLFWLLTQLLFILIQKTEFIQPENKAYLLYFPLFHLNEFFAGNMLGLYMTSKTFSIKSSVLSLSVFLLLLLLLHTNIPKMYFHNGLLVPVFCLLIFLITADYWFLSNLFKNKYLIILGEISYGVYIYQLPVYKLSMFFFRKVLKLQHSDMFFYITLLILILVSFLSYKYIERPAVKFAKAYVSNRFVNKYGSKQTDGIN